MKKAKYLVVDAAIEKITQFETIEKALVHIKELIDDDRANVNSLYLIHGYTIKFNARTIVEVI